MGKFTVELPFEIGQGIWTRTTVNGEAVDTLVTVEDYTINEFGVEISVSVPGKDYPESLEISYDHTPSVDAQQVADQWLFETKAELDRYFAELDRYFKDKGW